MFLFVDNFTLHLKVPVFTMILSLPIVKYILSLWQYSLYISDSQKSYSRCLFKIGKES